MRLLEVLLVDVDFDVDLLRVCIECVDVFAVWVNTEQPSFFHNINVNNFPNCATVAVAIPVLVPHQDLQQSRLEGVALQEELPHQAQIQSQGIHGELGATQSKTKTGSRLGGHSGEGQHKALERYGRVVSRNREVIHILQVEDINQARSNASTSRRDHTWMSS